MNDTFKFFIIVVIIIIVLLIVANVELKLVEQKAIYTVPLNKTYLILPPSKTGLQEPIYIYNSKKIKSKSVPKISGYNENSYKKCCVDKHLATKLNDKLKELVSVVTKVPKSSMPINTIYSVISKGEEMASTIDPAINDTSYYRALHSVNDKIEFFINNDILYIMHIK